MAQNENPDQPTGLFREDQMANANLANATDVWREKQGNPTAVPVTNDVQDDYTDRARDVQSNVADPTT